MAIIVDSARKPFDGVCPVCGGVGLEISGTGTVGVLKCPSCMWDSNNSQDVAVGVESSELHPTA